MSRRIWSGTYQLCAETFDLCLLCTDGIAQVLELTSRVHAMTAAPIDCSHCGVSIAQLGGNLGLVQHH